MVARYFTIDWSTAVDSKRGSSTMVPPKRTTMFKMLDSPKM